MSKHVKIEGQPDGKIVGFDPGRANIPTSTESLTKERGEIYGHPKDHFWCTQKMYDVWIGTRCGREGPIGILDPAEPVHHAVYMILDKLSRLAHTIDHEDSWDDVAGYVACAKKILFEEKS